MANITRAVNVVSASCVKSLAVNETPVSIVTPNLRISAVVTSQEALASGIHLTIAQSPIELLSGAPAAASRVGTAGIANGDAVGMSLVQYNSNPLNAFINTTALSVYTSSIQFPPTSRRRLAGVAQESGEYIVLQNKQTIKYLSFLPTEMQVKCITPLEDASYPVHGVCPGGYPYTVECPARVRGRFNITCNGVKTQPVCASFDGASFVKDDRCEVVSFTSTNTTCFCRIETDTRKRRLQLRSEVVTYAATMSRTTTPFKASFVAVPAMTESLSQNALLSSMGVILGLLILGLLAFAVWDTQGKATLNKRRKVLAQGPDIAEQDNDRILVTDRTILSFYNSILPDLFRNSEEPLRSLFVKAMWEHHTWLRVFNELVRRKEPQPVPTQSVSTSASKEVRQRFVEYWVVALGKSLTFIFFNSFLATVVYPYDGSCEDILDEIVCADQKSHLGLYQACEWSYRSESCGYRGPQLRILHILIFAAIVIATSTVYNRLLDSIFHSAFAVYYDADLRSRIIHQWRSCWRRIRGVDQIIPYQPELHRDVIEVPSVGLDEFVRYDTVQLCILRTARIVKTNYLLKRATSEEETNLVLYLRREAKLEAWQREARKFLWHFDVPHEMTPYDRRCPKDNKYGGMTRYVTQSRMLGARLVTQLQKCKKNEERERLLMTMFCLDSLPVSVQSVASRAMLSDDDRSALSHPYCNASVATKDAIAVLAVVLAVAHFAVQLTLLGVWDRYIVTSNAALWGYVLLTAMVQYYVFQECAVVFLKNVLVEQVLVGSKVIERLELLARKTKLILMRRLGLMRDANALVQHFNPACRAARSFPQLPVARLLLSVGDHDFYGLTLPVKKAFLSKMLTMLVESPLLLFAFVPYRIGELLTDLVVVVLASGMLLGLYFLGVYSPVAAIVIASALIAAPVVYELFLIYRARKERHATVMDGTSALHKYFYDINKEMTDWRDETVTEENINRGTAEIKKKLTVKPSEPSKASRKSLFSGLRLSSAFLGSESSQRVAGAFVSTTAQAGLPIHFKPDRSKEATQLAMSPYTRQVRVAPTSPEAPNPSECIRESESSEGQSADSGDSSHTHHRFIPTNTQRGNGALTNNNVGNFGALAGPQRIAGRGIALFDHTAPSAPSSFSSKHQSTDDVHVDFLEVSAEVFDPEVHGELSALSAEWDCSVIEVPDIAVSSLLDIAQGRGQNKAKRSVESRTETEPRESQSKEKPVDTQEDSPDEFWDDLGLLRDSGFGANAMTLSLARPPPLPSRCNSATRSRSATRARSVTPTTSMSTAVNNNPVDKNKNNKPFISRRQLRRAYDQRHGSPETAQKLHERHRAGCEARPPGANALQDILPAPSLAITPPPSSKYAHVMLVSAEEELPAIDILANADKKETTIASQPVNISREANQETASPTSTAAVSSGYVPPPDAFSDPLCTPMSRAPLHPIYPVYSTFTTHVDSPNSDITESERLNSLVQRARQKHMRSRHRHLT